MAPRVAGMRKLYSVDVVDQAISGIPTRIITPRDKTFDRHHVLINLHGGGFSMCADACAMLESVPIASLGGYKVVTVNYRMAPEAAHPAGVEDVATVYRELLKSYKPKHIGIYGCSAAARSPRKRRPGCRHMVYREQAPSASSARARCASAPGIRHGLLPISTAPSRRRQNLTERVPTSPVATSALRHDRSIISPAFTPK